MPQAVPIHAILLRAIGPATHGLMSMTQWREASAAAGFIAPETLVNTGNMVAGFAGTGIEAEQAMVPVLRGFGLGENVIPIGRSPARLQGLLAANPVAEAAATRPAETAIYFFAARQPDFTWLAAYDGPERVHVVDDHLVIDFHQPVAKSGRLIRLIDKHCGSSTARNWNSMRRLTERAVAREGAC